MMERKKRLWYSSAAGVALVCAIAALADIASQYVYARLDLSRGRLYSISSGTKRILGSLPDPILIRVYSSKELPPQIEVSLRYLRDILKEYSRGSGGKVRARFIEVGDSSKEREEALQSGIAPVRFDIYSQEKFEQREGFLGLAIQYQDKKDVIPYLQDTSGLEYELTSRIKALSQAHKPVLGFAEVQRSMGPGTLDPSIAERLNARYDLQDVNLDAVSPDSGIPAGIGVLFLLGPQGRVPDRTLSLLDRYFSNGGALGVAVDTKRVDTRSFYASDLESGLLPFLKAHGFEVEPTLVFDAQSQPIEVSMRQGVFMVTNVVQYPPMVLSTKLSATNPITQHLNSLVVPFASPIKADKDADVLVQSSEYSWAKRPAAGGFEAINPFQFPSAGTGDEKGPFVLAAAKTSAGRGRLAVISSSKMFDPQFKAQENDAVFFMNLADWLSQDTDLISIRSKTATFSALREVPAPLKRALRWANIFVPPILAVSMGLWMWRRKAARRVRARAEYASA